MSAPYPHPVSANTRILDASMLKLGFEEVKQDEVTIPRMVLCTQAQEKRGKTHFAFTAPGPIGVLSTDAGTREVMRKFLPNRRVIYKTLASAKELIADKAGTDAVNKAWTDTRSAMEAMVGNKLVRTIVCDTATEMWELCRLCRFGKLSQVMPHHYPPVNDEFRKSILKLPYEREGLNCIFIHKEKREYKSGKDGKDSWTGRFERAGFNDAPYIADIVLRHYRSDKLDAEANEPRCAFGITVMDSRYQPDTLIGVDLEGADATFQMLGFMAFPETDLDYWE